MIGRYLCRSAQVLVLGLFALPLAASTLNPSGDLDTTFASPNGKTAINYKTGLVSADSRALIVQPDGKIVIGGGSNNGVYKDYTLVRVTTAGVTDTTFAGGGIVRTEMGFDDHINAMAQLPNGTRFCGGGIAKKVFGVACYTRAGELDVTFSGDGLDQENVPALAGVDYGSNVGRIEGMTYDRNGRLVVVGWGDLVTSPPGQPVVFNRKQLVLRFNTDGSVDNTFGNSGWVRIDFAANSQDRAFDITVLNGATPNQDRYLVTGTRTQPSKGTITLLNYNGTLDTTSNTLMGTAGTLEDNPGGITQFRGVAQESDGHFVVTGQGSSGFKVIRYILTAAANTADVSANLGTTGNDVGYRVRVSKVLGVDKVYASGTTNDGTDMRVARLTANLATAEYNTGVDFAGGSDFPYDLAVDPVSGFVTACGVAGGNLQQIAAARFDASGVLDPGFSGDGKYTAVVTGGTTDFPAAMAVQSDDKVVTTGITLNDQGNYDLLTARINANGTLDTTFNAAGAVPGFDQRGFDDGVAAPNTEFFSEDAKAVGIDPTASPAGRIVVVGSTYGSSVSDYVVMRYLTNGTLDTSFDGDGIKRGSWGANTQATAVGFQSNGSVIVGGEITLNGPFKFSRLAVGNGAVDSGFGSSGVATVTVPTATGHVLKSMAIDSQNRIVAAGQCFVGGVSKMCLARLSASGTLDGTFGSGGTKLINNLSGDDHNNDSFDVRSIKLLPDLDTADPNDYKIVAAGQIVLIEDTATPGVTTSKSRWLVTRFNYDGALDTTFSPTSSANKSPGVLALPPGPSTYVGAANSISLQYDEKLIVAGEASAPDTFNVGYFEFRQYTVVRINWDGTLDTTYADNGFRYTTIGADPGEAYQVSVFPQSSTNKGKAVTTGFVISSDYGFARYQADPAPIAGASTPDLDVASDLGRVNSDNITKDTTPTFTGTCSEGETVYLLVGVGAAPPTQTQPRTRQICPTGGTYALTPTLSGIPRTNYSIATLTQTGIGDGATSVSLNPVTIDAEINPAVVINNPTAGSNQLPNVSVDGTSEAVAAVTVSTDHPKGGGCSVAVLANGNANGSGSGNWTCSNTAFKQGPHTISVVQTDLAGNVASAVTRSFSVKVPTTTGIVSSVNPSKYGQPVTFTATVTPGANADLSLDGTSVRFVEGATTLATVALTASGVGAAGTATFTPSGLGLSVGFHTIQAVYDENTNWLSSSGQVIQEVQKADTATALTSTVNPSVFGQSVTFTATVTSVAPGAGTPSGTVTFLDGGSSIGTGALNGSGVATFSTTALSVGNHTITADYGGSGNYNISSGSLTGNPQVVNKANTTTAVTSSLNPSILGQSVTFTATVTAVLPGAGTPSGTVTFLDGGNSIGTGTLNGSGVATFSTTALAVGNHTITTNYAGDGNFFGSTGSLTGNPQVVNKKPTTTTLTSSQNPAVFGQSVTFTATVVATPPHTGTPTGDVTFLDGGSSIGTGTLNGSGVATFTTSTLAVGNHTITAHYEADTNFDVSTGSLTGNPQVINKANTSTAVTSSANPSVFGQSITFTATVSATAPGAGMPGGTVSFLDGGTPIGSGTLAGGIATFSTTTLIVGNHTITTSYPGDGNFNSSTGSLTGNPQVVGKANTSTAVTSSQNPTVFGESVTFTATVGAVAPGGGTPTGTVTFLDGANPIGSATLVAGVATFATTTLAVGDHTITTSYAGDTNFNGSLGSLTGNPQHVDKADTTTDVTSSANPSVIGEAVTFTATVSATAPGGGTPSGDVTFLDGGVSIGTGTLAGGIATFTTSTLSLGSHSITTDYAGDGSFNGSTGTLTGDPQVVTKSASITTVASSANPSVTGQAVTFTATVAAAPPGSGTPTGTVTFLDGGSPIGSGTLSGGIATFTTSILVVGNHTITADYGGDSNFDVSSGALAGNPQVVNKADTTTATVTSSQNPSKFGQMVTFTATISAVAPGAGTPTGSVTFLDGGSPIGSGPLAGGIATFSTSALTTGNHTITTSYGGDGDFNGSGGSLTGNPQVVDKADTTTTLTSSQNPSVFGEAVTFTATLAAVSPGAGSATGTVTFLDGGNVIGSGALGAGIATFTTSALAIGNHTITTSYGGDGDFNGSTGSLTGNPQVVNKADTTTAVTSSLNPSVIGQSVTFTATVSATAPGAGVPTGNVNFLDGGSPIGTGTLAGGIATFATSTLTIGNHTITTSYPGDGNFNGSTGSLTGNPQVVNKPGTTTALTSSLNPSIFGEAVTFTATVTVNPPGAGTATGTVTFRDGGTAIGTGLLDASGTTTFTTSTLAAGNHTITADYGGDVNFAGSTGSLTGNPQVVNKADTTTAVTSSANASVFGQSVTFTATISAVAPGAGIPTGSVTFLDGGNPIGTGSLNGSGIATFATSTLAIGNHTITTSYTGDGNFNGSTGSLTGNPQVVSQANTATAVASSANPSVFGQAVTFTATVTAVSPGAGTATGTVTFLDGGNPIGSGALNGSGVATFTTSALVIGNHTITTTYAGDSNFNGSPGSLTGNPQVVGKANSTAVTQLSPPGPITVGASVQLQATVTAAAPGAGTPTGNVTFLDGATSLGTVALSGGVASLTKSTWTVGSHSITSSYGGDGNFKSTVSAPAILSVTPPTRTITASAGANGSITPSTQYVVDGNTASFTVTPNSGFTAMMGTTCPEGLGTLNNNVYTTRAISQDCAVTATFNSASATLALTLTDNRAFVHYGGFINYIVTVSNSSGNDATGLTISGAETSPSSDLDTANGHWQCLGTAAECLPTGTGAFLDGNVTVPANSSVSWIVSIPKRPNPPDGLASYAVTLSGTTPSLMQFDTDIFVIFRDGFDVQNGDGAQSIEPDVSAMTLGDWDGSSLALTPMPTSSGVIGTLFEATAPDHSGFRVERFGTAEQDWLRIVAFGPNGQEQQTAWVRLAPMASVWLGTAATQEHRELVLVGGEVELNVPIAASAAWKVRAAQPVK